MTMTVTVSHNRNGIRTFPLDITAGHIPPGHLHGVGHSLFHQYLNSIRRSTTQHVQN